MNKLKHSLRRKIGQRIVTTLNDDDASGAQKMPAFERRRMKALTKKVMLAVALVLAGAAAYVLYLWKPDAITASLAQADLVQIKRFGLFISVVGLMLLWDLLVFRANA